MLQGDLFVQTFILQNVFSMCRSQPQSWICRLFAKLMDVFAATVRNCTRKLREGQSLCTPSFVRCCKVVKYSNSLESLMHFIYFALRSCFFFLLFLFSSRSSFAKPKWWIVNFLHIHKKAFPFRFTKNMSDAPNLASSRSLCVAATKGGYCCSCCCCCSFIQKSSSIFILSVAMPSVTPINILLFAMLPIQLNLVLIELPFKCLLRLAS